MRSFFSRFKDKLDGNYGGRYMGSVLCETINSDCRIGQILFGNRLKLKSSFHRAQPEHSFVVGRRRRVADVAITDIRTGEVTGLVEIKYEDQDAPKNAAQLKDYVKHAEEDGIPFVYLTQYVPPDNDLRIVGSSKRGAHMFYGQFYRELRKLSDDSLAAKMLRDFLREETDVFEPEIDEDALMLFMMRSMGKSSGMGRLNSRDRMVNLIPDTLSKLLGNAAVITDSVLGRPGEGLYNQAPAVDFRIIQNIYTEATRRHLSKEDSDEVFIPDRCLAGEEMWMGGSFKVVPVNHWCRIGVGLSFELQPSEDTPFTTSSYAYVFSKELKAGGVEGGVVETHGRYRLGDQEDKAIKSIGRCVTKVIGELNKKHKGIINKRQMKSLNALAAQVKKSFG